MKITDRTERLLALILINLKKEAPDKEKIELLSLAGFSNIEIADIVQTTSANVSQQLYVKRKSKK